MLLHSSVRRRTGFKLLRALVAFVVLTPRGVIAQSGTVSGRVVIVEKPGQKTTDLDNAVVWLTPTGTSAAKPRQSKVELAMRARQFAPHVRVVAVGSTVAFPNQDPFGHNIFSSTPGSSFDLGLYGRGQTREQVFSKAGAIPVYCNIHSRMAAFVVVVSSPWYAQASADGRWSISGVPPGTYTAHIWHERGAETSRSITVTAQGLAGIDTQLDARGFVLTEHKDKFGKNYTGPGQIKY